MQSATEGINSNPQGITDMMPANFDLQWATSNNHWLKSSAAYNIGRLRLDPENLMIPVPLFPLRLKLHVIQSPTLTRCPKGPVDLKFRD